MNMLTLIHIILQLTYSYVNAISYSKNKGETLIEIKWKKYTFFWKIWILQTHEPSSIKNEICLRALKDI